MVHLPLDDGALSLRPRLAAQPHHLQRGRHRRQRIAQLVSEHRQELVFRPVCTLGRHSVTTLQTVATRTNGSIELLQASQRVSMVKRPTAGHGAVVELVQEISDRSSQFGHCGVDGTDVVPTPEIHDAPF